MRMSQLVGRREKDDPKDAQLVSHRLLLRGGYVRQVGAGLFSLLPLAVRVVRKIERIIREEMDAVGGQEVLMPVVLPRELWEESGRYAAVGQELLRFRDRTGKDMVLGMTHEEAVLHLARTELRSHRQLPAMLYQIQTKFRDEARSRGGLIRVREFTMKDAYSFHRDQACLEATYQRVHEAYERIFRRAGLKNCISVASDTGMMGGAMAHEFMLLSEAGEDGLLVCEACAYRANREVATTRHANVAHQPEPLEKVATPGASTIEAVAALLGLEPEDTCKAVFFKDAKGGLVFLLVRGDLEVNEAKLRRLLRQRDLVRANDELIVAHGVVPGFATPIGTDSQRYRLVLDESLRGAARLVTGANETGFHLRGFNPGRDLAGFRLEWADISEVTDGSPCPSCGGRLSLKRGIEVGNIFQLGDKYTKAMHMTCLDAHDTEATPIMGCYGIGVGRLLAAVIEDSHDAGGPIWPESVAPFQVHICALDPAKEGVMAAAEAAADALSAAGVEVILDDRGEKTGAQFAEADLLGVPHRLIYSPRNLKEGQVEYRTRASRDSVRFPVDTVVGEVRARLGRQGA